MKLQARRHFLKPNKDAATSRYEFPARGDKPATMTFKDSSLNSYIKEPVREGWECGEGLI